MTLTGKKLDNDPYDEISNTIDLFTYFKQETVLAGKDEAKLYFRFPHLKETPEIDMVYKKLPFDIIQLFSQGRYIGSILPSLFIANVFDLDENLKRNRKLKLFFGALRKSLMATVMAHGKATGHCAICGQPLSTPDSKLLGADTNCLEKLKRKGH